MFSAEDSAIGAANHIGGLIQELYLCQRDLGAPMQEYILDQLQSRLSQDATEYLKKAAHWGYVGYKNSPRADTFTVTDEFGQRYTLKREAK